MSGSLQEVVFSPLVQAIFLLRRADFFFYPRVDPPTKRVL